VTRGAAWLIVRGAVAVAVVASAACGPRRVSTTGEAGPSTVVLLAEPDGSVGRAAVTSTAGAGVSWVMSVAKGLTSFTSPLRVQAVCGLRAKRGSTWRNSAAENI